MHRIKVRSRTIIAAQRSTDQRACRHIYHYLNSLHLYASIPRFSFLVSALTFLCSQGVTGLIRSKSLLFKVTATVSCTSPCHLRCVEARVWFKRAQR